MDVIAEKRNGGLIRTPFLISELRKKGGPGMNIKATSQSAIKPYGWYRYGDAWQRMT
jgi:hypothetical protein